MNFTKTIAVSFLAVLALFVAALTFAVWKPDPHTIMSMMNGASGLLLFGAVTITYRSVNTGTTTPPTALQAAQLKFNSVVATVQADANGDAAAVITHMLNSSALDITHGWPTVLFEPLSIQAQTSNWFAVSHDPNWLGLVKGNTAGGGVAAPQLKVTIAKPHSIVR